MAADKPLMLRFAGFELDEANARLSRDGHPLALQPRALALLCALARQSGRLVGKDDLLDAVWGHRHVSESVLKGCISSLRQALGDDARQPRFIETVARKGYRFMAIDNSLPQSLPAAGLVGRRAELQHLQRMWQCTAAAPRLVWLSGEAGIGKSRLIEAFASQLPGVLWARGQCLERVGGSEPYLPWLAVFAELCRSDPPFADLLRGVAPLWLLQLPWLTSAAEHETLRRRCAGVHPQRMLREAAELLQRYCACRPLLVVLEDLHWCDGASLELLEYLMRRGDAAHLLLLGSLRPGHGQGRVEGLRAELKLLGLSEEITLRPLDRDELGEFLRRRRPEIPLTDALLTRFHRRSGGLPLFAAGLLDALGEAGEGDEDVLPDSLEAWLGRQIERLDGPQRELLTVASVCGVAFPLSVLSDVLACAEPLLRQRCRSLAGIDGWLIEQALRERSDGQLEGGFAFRHDLFRQAFYQRMDRLRLAQLHRLVAAALQRHGVASAAERAEHLERGLDVLSAVDCWREAALQALGRFAPGQAVQFVQHGLALLASRAAAGDEQRLGLLLMGAVASAQQQGMASAEADQFYVQAQQLAAQLADSPALGWGLAGIAQVRYGRGEYRTVRDLCERLLALAARLQAPLLEMTAYQLLGMVCAVCGEHVRGRQLLEQGIALGLSARAALEQQPFVVDPLVAMQAHLGLHLLPLGLYTQAADHIEAALARARAQGQPLTLAVATRCAAMLHLHHDQPRQVADCAAELARLHAEHGLRQAEGASLVLGGWAMARLGQAQAGYARLCEGGAMLQGLGMLAGQVQVLAFAAEALLWTDAPAQAVTLLDEAEQLAVRLGERARLPELGLLRARCELKLDARGRAEAELRRALEEARAQGAAGMQLRVLLALNRLPEPSPGDRAELIQHCTLLDPQEQGALLAEAGALTEV